MTNSDFFHEYGIEDTHSPLRDLALRYHAECEAYDRTVCTGIDSRDGSALPITIQELALVNRNARRVFADLAQLAHMEGFSHRDLWKEIGRTA